MFNRQHRWKIFDMLLLSTAVYHQFLILKEMRQQLKKKLNQKKSLRIQKKSKMIMKLLQKNDINNIYPSHCNYTHCFTRRKSKFYPCKLCRIGLGNCQSFCLHVFSFI